jgi:hypothetical protein
MDTPQEIVRELLRCRFLEAGHDRPGGIEGPEDLSDSPVLAAHIRTLQYHQQGKLGLGVEDFLQAVDFADIGRRRGFSLRSLEGYGFAVSRVDVGKLSFPFAGTR